LQTAVRIARTAADAPDPNALEERAVTLIREGLDLHYVGLFVLDETGQWAVLRAGTGEEGRRMVAQGVRIHVGDISTVGLCTASGQVHITPDLSAASSRRPIPVSSLVPETRSEMALPLRSGDHVIGALVVHSTQHEAFSQQDTVALQTVADQLTVAIEHARDLAETRVRLAEMNARWPPREIRPWTGPRRPEAISYHERTQTETAAPVADGNSDEPAEALRQAIEQAMAQQAVVVGTDVGDEAAQSTVVAPLSLRGEVIGALGLCDPEGKQHWTTDEIALVEAIADQMALALENVRLLEETQQRAERDRLIASITARIRSSMDTQTILQTAVRELGTALGSDRTFIRLSTSSSPSEE
jgi:GAF domain-containing protein